MIKQLFKRSKKRQDMRFVHLEEYKEIGKKKSKSVVSKPVPSVNSLNSLNTGVGYSASTRSSNAADAIEWSAGLGTYMVDYGEVDTPILVKPPRELNKTTQLQNLDNNFSLSKINSAVNTNNQPVNNLGIFSDTRMYSALIKSELNKFDLNISHFNHPKTFTPSNYPFFDSVSAWIIFLSEDCDDHFLDQFIDRYVNKPTLFLCPKTSRIKTSQKMKQFILDSDLENKIPTQFTASHSRVVNCSPFVKFLV